MTWNKLQKLEGVELIPHSAYSQIITCVLSCVKGSESFSEVVLQFEGQKLVSVLVELVERCEMTDFYSNLNNEANKLPKFYNTFDLSSL